MVLLSCGRCARSGCGCSPLPRGVSIANRRYRSWRIPLRMCRDLQHNGPPRSFETNVATLSQLTQRPCGIVLIPEEEAPVERVHQRVATQSLCIQEATKVETDLQRNNRSLERLALRT